MTPHATVNADYVETTLRRVLQTSQTSPRVLHDGCVVQMSYNGNLARARRAYREQTRASKYVSSSAYAGLRRF